MKKLKNQSIHIKIVVSRHNGKPISMDEFKKLPSYERTHGKWYGKVQKFAISVPDRNNIKSIEIKEV